MNHSYQDEYSRTQERQAYQGAQDRLDNRRDALVDQAVAAHDRGDETEAKRLMDEASALPLKASIYEDAF